MKKLTNNEFKDRLKNSHPYLTILSPYTKSRAFVIVQDQYGIKYKVIANTLLQNQIPTIQTALDKTNCFITKAINIHKNKYMYDKVIYTNNKNKVIITCPYHGDFLQTPANHLQGQTCPKCNVGGYSKSHWIRFCNNKKDSEPKVYIIRCFNTQENFIKIGRTSNSVFKRFSYKLLPYEFEVIKEIKGSPSFVFDKENELHKLCRHFQYYPKIYFEGITECFTLKVLELIT